MNIPLETSPSQPAGENPPSARRPYILVVDDDALTRQLNAKILIHSGYAVDTASDGLAAWQALEKVRYDLLITDHQMPRVTGLELIEKMRARAMDLPVILATGCLPTEELRRLPHLKIEAVLQKSGSLEEFLETVRRVLSALGKTFGHRPPSPAFPRLG